MISQGEDYVAAIEHMCDSMTTSDDWADGSGPMHFLNHLQKVFDVFQKEEENVHRLGDPLIPQVPAGSCAALATSTVVKEPASDPLNHG